MTTESTTIRVLADRLTEAQAALNKLAAKARRYGCPDITITMGEQSTAQRIARDWDGEERSYTVQEVELIITGEAPRIGNHEFLARVELGGEAGNLVDTRPGVEDLDVKFRHTNGYCAHCNTTRKRNEVFVVRNIETGEQLQIGRDCLRDYLGLDSPTSIAHRFAFWRALREFEGDFCRAKAEWAQSLIGVLMLSAVCIRLFGWCSKGQAAHDPSLTPTSEYVYKVLCPGTYRMSAEELNLIKQIESSLSDADRATATEVVRWVREDLAGNSDYEHNLKVIFTADNVNDARRLGLVVSAVSAYHRAVEQKLRLTKDRAVAQASQHVGEIGKRLRDVPVTLQLQRVIGGNEWADSILIKFVDDAGNLLTWITSKGSGLQIGERALLTGTVKDHAQFNGANETRMTRCVLAPAQEKAA